MAYMTPRLILLALWTCLAGILPVSAQQSDTRVALLIGNAAYPDAEAPLRDPVNNVRSLADELRRTGFDVDIGENLTKEAMRAAIDRFYGKIKPGSTALLFFSGYGIQSDRQTYVIPVNAQIWTEADVRRDGYSFDLLLAEMNKRGAGVKIAILDASRRNPFERRFRAVAAGLAPVIVPKGTIVMYAAAPGAVARDGDRPIFVSELIKEIRGPGRIEEAFNRTLVAVSRSSQGEQVPMVFLFPGRGFLVCDGRACSPRPGAGRGRGREKACGSAPVVEEKKPAPPPSDPDANARREYQSAERVGTKKSWEDFVARYPSGRYADMAREQIAKLAPPAAPAVRADDPVIKELDTKIRLNPGDAVAYYKRGQLYAQRGEFARAVRDFDEVLRLNPRDPEALNNRCWARAVIGELQPALKDCDNALEIRPRYLDAHDSRGFVNLKMGQASSAIADYDAALKIDPRHASSLYGRGIAKLRVGNAAGGNGDIAAAKGIQPGIADEFAGYGIR